MVFSSTLLETFASRPPTPPRDVNRDIADALDFLDESFVTSQVLKRPIERKLFVSTPPEQSPSSSAEPPLKATRKRRKRVDFDFSSCTDDQTQKDSGHWTTKSTLRPLPQTRIPVTLKSILKAYDPSTTFNQTSATESTHPGPISAHNFETFAEMLESVTQQLAKEARQARLDAYICLMGTLKAYDSIPDTKALVSKTGLLSQFIRRDMTALNSVNALDSVLITQALKLLMALVRIPSVVEVMDPEFCSFVIDRSTDIAEDSKAPKSVVNTHLCFLMQQSFGTRVMTAARAERIVDAIHDITDRVKGNGVYAYRLLVYRKLIGQAPNVMISKIRQWFEHVFHAMLSSQKDTRQHGIDIARLAGMEFGTNSQASKAVLDFLNTSVVAGGSMASYLVDRLMKMLDKKEEAPPSPQIWGAITLFLRPALRNSDRERWRPLRSWLTIFERFLNSNSQVKYHANIAFNSLVFVVNPDRSTTPAMANLLRNIPQGQLELRSRCSTQESQIAIASYYTLLYYSLRPSASEEELRRYWNEFVYTIWSSLISSSTKNANAGCRVLSALFGANPPRIWNEQRALQSQPIRLEELPRLDPKWMRKHVALVLETVDLCLGAASWTSCPSGEDAVKTMWSCLMNSIAEAGSKEVKASMELKDAIAHIVNFLHKVWSNHTSSHATQERQEDEWAEKFGFLVETAMQKLGAFNFADKFLTRNSEADDFEVAPTPSHRSRNNGGLQSPVLDLVDLLSNQSEGKLPDSSRLALVKTVVEPCWKSRNTTLLKLELLKECSVIARITPDAGLASKVWESIAQLTEATLNEGAEQAVERQSRQFGEECGEIVKILAHGIRYSSPRSVNVAKDLLTTFIAKVRQQAGDGATILAIIEPLSEAIRVEAWEQSVNIALVYAATLLNNLPQTINRRQLEHGRKALWSASPIPPRAQDFDPYNHLYKGIVALSTSCYENFDFIENLNLKEFISSLARSIQNCPISLLGLYLRKIQNGIAFWIEDSECKLQTKEKRTQDLYHEVLALWQTISAAVERLPRNDSSLLVALEVMIAAGFSSRRRGMVNVSIETWNCTFGVNDKLEYPPKIKLALKRIRPFVDLRLPTFPEGDDAQGIAADFYDSENDDELTPKQATIVGTAASPLPTLKVASLHSSSAKSTPLRRSSRTPLKQISKTRLRHDNSQIHFEAIESSPLNSVEQESQVLTDRQKEMFEKQQATAAMFPDIRSSPVTQPAIRTSDIPQLNLTSDASNIDEPLDEGLRTPLTALPSLEPIDYYLGSSPTPRARTRSQHRLNNDRMLAAPTNVRPIHSALQPADIPSSPPDLEETYDDADFSVLNADVHVQVEDSAPNSFERPQVDEDDRLPQDIVEATDHEELVDDPEGLCDDLSEDMDLAAVLNGDDQSTPDATPVDEPWSELPSSTADLELSAQIAAEMTAHLKRPEPEADEDDQSPLRQGQTASQQAPSDAFSDSLSSIFSSTSSADVFVDASASASAAQNLVQRTPAPTTAPETPPAVPPTAADPPPSSSPLPSHLETSTQEVPSQSASDVSRVGDSFAFAVTDAELAALQSCLPPAPQPEPEPEPVRRSPRKSVAVGRAAARKRKEGPVRGGGVGVKRRRVERVQSLSQEEVETEAAQVGETVEAQVEEAAEAVVVEAEAASPAQDSLLDCIVVAVSSPPASRETSPEFESKPGNEPLLDVTATVPAVVPAADHDEEEEEPSLPTAAPEVLEPSPTPASRQPAAEPEPEPEPLAPEPVAASAKRKPGRPRKSGTEARSSRSSRSSRKRRASRLSAAELDIPDLDADLDDDGAAGADANVKAKADAKAEAEVEVEPELEPEPEPEPAPAKRSRTRPDPDAEAEGARPAKRLRGRASLQDGGRGLSAPSSEAGSVAGSAGSGRVRRVSHIEISAGGRRGKAAEEKREEEEEAVRDTPVRDVLAAAETETTEEEASGVRTPSRAVAVASAVPPAVTETSSMSSLGRAMLTPRSILGRLRKIIADCSQLVLGSQEERQFDDVLFELRTEVHAAGRRGRGAE